MGSVQVLGEFHKRGNTLQAVQGATFNGVSASMLRAGNHWREADRSTAEGDDAGVVKLVDALDSKSSDPRGHGGSTPPSGTTNPKGVAA